MSGPSHAVTAAGLGKQFRIGTAAPYATLREGIERAARSLVGRRGDSQGSRAELFWALRDVSFAVPHGQVMGIVGANGAGKTTLLKILSRITEPTRGHARIDGHVGSLLEVGTGFHPELTGRENIVLNGAILGMSRRQVRSRFDEIVDFAEVHRFIDTPVKRFSTGMRMRLAFAVAAHLEPEILIVDEVLAVGDAAFQQRCLGRMAEVAGSGRTVLFVSHNMPAVASLCDRAVWLRGGEVAGDGPAGAIVSGYLRSLSTPASERRWEDAEHAPGNDDFRLSRVRVRPSLGDSAGPIGVGTPFVIEIDYWNLRPGALLNLSLHVYDEHGTMAFNALPMKERAWQGRPFPRGLFRDTVHVPGGLMNDGLHSVELLAVHDGARVILREPELVTFEVQDDAENRGGWFGDWPGAVRPIFEWTTEHLGSGGSPEAHRG